MLETVKNWLNVLSVPIIGLLLYLLNRKSKQVKQGEAAVETADKTAAVTQATKQAQGSRVGYLDIKKQYEQLKKEHKDNGEL